MVESYQWKGILKWIPDIFVSQNLQNNNDATNHLRIIKIEIVLFEYIEVESIQQVLLLNTIMSIDFKCNLCLEAVACWIGGKFHSKYVFMACLHYSCSIIPPSRICTECKQRSRSRFPVQQLPHLLNKNNKIESVKTCFTFKFFTSKKLDFYRKFCSLTS